MDIKDVFKTLANGYTNDEALVANLWHELEQHYSAPKRFYHTLGHLHALLTQLTKVRPVLQDWETVLFTLFYHDIVYNPLKSDNEEQSATLAEQRMLQLAVPLQKISLCKAQILATKSHQPASDSDTNYFTDADLSVLGQSRELYSDYCKNVRKEYSMFPDLLYNPGRKKVLHHFLSMDRIFKTAFFYDQYELQAKQNIQWELASLA